MTLNIGQVSVALLGLSSVVNLVSIIFLLLLPHQVVNLFGVQRLRLVQEGLGREGGLRRRFGVGPRWKVELAEGVLGDDHLVVV